MTLADAFVRSGKVRDLYEIGADRLLLVASDRLSAFDVVLPTPIPDKGRVLTGLSRFWFAETAAIVAEPPAGDRPGRAAPGLARDRDARSGDGPVSREAIDGAAGAAELRGRMMLCRRARRSCRSRSSSAATSPGSGWKDYRRTGAVCGIAPAGRPARERPAAGADPHAVDEGGGRGPRRDHRLRHDGRADLPSSSATGRSAGRRAPSWPSGSATSPSPSTATARPSPPRAGILLADTKFEFGLGAGRRARPGRRGADPGLVAVLGRRGLRAGPGPGELRQAVRPRLARGPAVGQDRPRARSCPPTSSPAPAPATSRRSSGSPARASRAISQEDVIAR